jgi:transcriptional regulator with XRE-family HTH domain
MSLPHQTVLHKDNHSTKIPRLKPEKNEGRHIRALAFLCGFTQKEIAVGLGVSPVNVHRTIYGKIHSARIEAEIARILGRADWNDVVLEARGEVQKKPVAVILEEMRHAREAAREAAKEEAGAFYTPERIEEADRMIDDFFATERGKKVERSIRRAMGAPA